MFDLEWGWRAWTAFEQGLFSERLMNFMMRAQINADEQKARRIIPWIEKCGNQAIHFDRARWVLQ